MQIAVLGTGVVGRAHAARLAELGHTVVIGTSDVAKTMAETQPDGMGSPPFPVWAKDHPAVRLATFAEAVAEAELVVEALKGEAVVSVLTGLAAALTGKVLMDISNPLDFSHGMPPSLFVCNTDSLGEQIQKALPGTLVVKACNTTNAMIQVNPGSLAGGDHHILICGNDAAAKKTVSELLSGYGWKHIIDLGDITNARGTEMWLPLWVRLFGVLKTPSFNLKIVTE